MLRDFLKPENKQKAAKLAHAARTSPAYFKNVAAGYQAVSTELALRLVRAGEQLADELGGLSLSLHELRPRTWEIGARPPPPCTCHVERPAQVRPKSGVLKVAQSYR